MAEKKREDRLCCALCGGRSPAGGGAVFGDRVTGVAVLCLFCRACMALPDFGQRRDELEKSVREGVRAVEGGP